MSKYLSRRHEEECADSGLTKETMRLAQLESVSDQERVHRALNWSPPRKHARNSLGECLVMPCFLPGETEPYAHIVKPEYPRTEKKRNGREKERKYESPKDAGMIQGFPNVPLGKSEWLQDTSMVQLLAEGYKKGLLLAQQGYAVVALTGVNNAHCSATRNPSGEPEGSGPYVLHPRILKYCAIADRECVIVFDSDYRRKREVRDAAMTLARMLFQAGAKSVKIAIPPDGDSDEKTGVDDYFVRVERSGQSGAEALARLIADAEVVDSETLDNRPRIVLSTNEHRVIDNASAALLRAPHIYSRAGKLVRVIRLESELKKRKTKHVNPATLAIAELPQPSLQETLTRYANIVQLKDDGGDVRDEPAHPPPWLVKGLASRSVWAGMNEIAGVIESPLLLSDGSLLCRDGYDRDTGLFVALAPGMEAVAVPERPSAQHVEQAVNALLDLVVDFPFVTEADRAAWLAGLLSFFGRELYEGPTPLFMVDAACAGSGKGMLVGIPSILATGHLPEPKGYLPDNPEEMGKRITSLAKSGERFVLFDNIEGPFGDSALNRALTTTSWKERLLGGNEEPRYPLLWTPWSTGNETQPVADMRRRVVPIRLFAKTEDPHDRAGFKHSNLLGHVRAHRAQYVSHALTVLRAFVLARKPQAGATLVGSTPAPVKELGSFEDWSRVVGGAVRWATGIDPLRSRKLLEKIVDPKKEALRAVLEALIKLGCTSAGSAMAAKKLIKAVTPEAWETLSDELEAARQAMVELAPGKPGKGEVDSQALGIALTRKSQVLNTTAGLAGLKWSPKQGTNRFWVELEEVEAVGLVGPVDQPPPEADHRQTMLNMVKARTASARKGPTSPTSPTADNDNDNDGRRRAGRVRP